MMTPSHGWGGGGGRGMVSLATPLQGKAGLKICFRAVILTFPWCSGFILETLSLSLGKDLPCPCLGSYGTYFLNRLFAGGAHPPPIASQERSQRR